MPYTESDQGSNHDEEEMDDFEAALWDALIAQQAKDAQSSQGHDEEHSNPGRSNLCSTSVHFGDRLAQDNELTEEEKEQLSALDDQGLTLEQMSKVMWWRPLTAIQQKLSTIMKAKGEKTAKMIMARDWTPRDDEELIRLWLDNPDERKIAQIVNRCIKHVVYRIKFLRYESGDVGPSELYLTLSRENAQMAAQTKTAPSTDSVQRGINYQHIQCRTWTKAEDEDLLRRWFSQYDEASIAKHTGRCPGSVEARLQSLKTSDDRSPGPSTLYLTVSRQYLRGPSGQTR
ncbi:hypothetical protein BDV96DRAFT_592996 [Lophiotrema nucula]|uniref:Myb-like domain-containing protein n=1 Tax=Lophiotrema nucula TaxID=690887 RepID=A0A6A5ZSI0_9PLEO|nr:hypothetical protein BDV96DRAFT_592996 [Lophiotrema nucula]